MGGLVTDLAYQMESRSNIRGKRLAPLENVDTLHSIATFG